VLVIPIDTHQPADASPRATSSAHRNAVAAGSSRAPTSTGAPARSKPESRSASTSSVGSLRAESMSSAMPRANSAISRARDSTGMVATSVSIRPRFAQTE
jgi:hypothetical protein